MTIHSFPSRSRSTGVTLIELMVTVSVFAIVVAIAVPSFSGIIASNRLTGPANEALSLMHFARSEAIRLNRTIEVCKSNAAATACDTSTGKWLGVLVVQPATSGAPTILRQLMFDTALTVNGTQTAMRFNAQGFIRSSTNAAVSGTLRVCLNAASLSQNSRDIDYVSGGRVSIGKKNITGCTAP